MHTSQPVVSGDARSRTDRGRLFDLFVIMGLLLPAKALAGEGDFFRPLVSAAYYHDSNIFRFAGDSEVPVTIGGEATGKRIQSVNYSLLGAGFLLDWQQSRQRIQARVQANSAKFSRYAALLDYDGHDLNARWDWQLGNRWRGQLGAERAKTLGSYDNVGVTSNTRTVSRYNFRAVRDLHTDWQAEAGYNRYASQYSSDNTRDVDVDAFNLGVYRLGGTLQRMVWSCATATCSTQTRPAPSPMRPNGGCSESPPGSQAERPVCAGVWGISTGSSKRPARATSAGWRLA